MMSNQITIQEPKLLDRVVVTPLLCGPGPVNIYPAVFESLSKPVITPLCEEYFNVVNDIRAGIKYMYQTKSDLVLAMSGAGHAGMEAVICNLVGPKETLLIATRGLWDERANIIAKRYGIKTIVNKVPLTKTFSLKALDQMLKEHKPTALFITHGDSTTGTVQNLVGLGELCHKYGTLLLVDTVVSIGGIEFLMDEWKIDAVYSSTQKALGGPAGISPIAFGPRAEKKIKNRNFEPPFYFDIKLLAPQWNCFGDTRAYHHTLSPPLLWALRSCLQILIAETLPKLWERHRVTTSHFMKRLQELPVKFMIPKLEDRLFTVTTVVLPEGYDYKEFIAYMKAKYDIVIFPGLGPTVGKALRVGLMGPNSRIEIADKVADAMTGTLIALKKSKL